MKKWLKCLYSFTFALLISTLSQVFTGVWALSITEFPLVFMMILAFMFRGNASYYTNDFPFGG